MPDISTPNLDYNDMVEAWDINDALMGGTLEMRRQGKKYLPKWPNEDPESYKERLASATLLPAYEEAIKQNIGRVFAEPTVLSEDSPEQISELAVRQLQRCRVSTSPIFHQARTFPAMSAVKTGSTVRRSEGHHPAPGWTWPRRRRMPTILSQTA